MYYHVVNHVILATTEDTFIFSTSQFRSRGIERLSQRQPGFEPRSSTSDQLCSLPLCRGLGEMVAARALVVADRGGEKCLDLSYILK